MTDIRLYMFQSGSQRCRLHNIKMNQGVDTDYEIPVPWFFLTHPKGHVVIDGGLAAEGLADPRSWWGDAVDTFESVMDESEGCVAQLVGLGIASEDVRFVILSHLHSDHSGAIGRFPNATHVIQRQEYEYAFTPDWFAAGAYARRDFDRPGLTWQFLEGDTSDGYDLYGDGVVRMIFTPGHSVGHQSFLVTIPEAGAILLTADAVYTMDHWREKALPGFMTSAVEAVRSVQKLRVLAARENAMIVTGHDPETWPSFKKAPEYYR